MKKKYIITNIKSKGNIPIIGSLAWSAISKWFIKSSLMIYLQKYQYVLTVTNKNKRDNIILIGFMGSGKSTIGKKLSKMLNMEFIDTDKYIEHHTGKEVKELFDQYGEDYFRQQEKKLIIDLKDAQNTIIATGGGMPCNPEILAQLKDLGSIFYLKLGIDKLYNRISKDKERPVALDKPKRALADLLKNRLQYYLQADHTIMAYKSPTEICQRIIKSSKSN
jgi:shikimate kinase